MKYKTLQVLRREPKKNYVHTTSSLDLVIRKIKLKNLVFGFLGRSIVLKRRQFLKKISLWQNYTRDIKIYFLSHNFNLFFFANQATSITFPSISEFDRFLFVPL